MPVRTVKMSTHNASVGSLCIPLTPLVQAASVSGLGETSSVLRPPYEARFFPASAAATA
jgi:hypothetical protein